MPVEIERKFLVRNDGWRSAADGGNRFRQGYIVGEDRCDVRIRIPANGQCTLTIKLAKSGVSRFEFEHPVELSEAEGLMELCEGAILDKTRFNVRHQGQTWEIDVYAGANTGLVVAEIELESEAQDFARPSWLGGEITGQKRYKNAMLSRQPFTAWSGFAGQNTEDANASA